MRLPVSETFRLESVRPGVGVSKGSMLEVVPLGGLGEFGMNMLALT